MFRRMIEVLALGESLIDFTSQSVDRDGYPTMAAHPGGAPANFLAALTKYGIKTAFYTKVGCDAFGRLLKGTFEKAGIDTRGVVEDPSVFTTLAFVTLDSEGDRTFSFARKPGADTCLEYSELDLSLIEQCRVFHFGSLSLTNSPSRETTKKAVEYAKSLNKTITFDPNLRVPLWDDLEVAKKEIIWGLENSDIVKISLEEIEFVFGCGEKEGASAIIENYGVKLVFVTLGKNGCYYSNGRAFGYVDNYNNVKTVDTTGAGDIFGGSAVFGVLKSGKAPGELSGDELENIVSFACGAASLSTTKYGGILSVPDTSEVEGLIGKKE